MTIKVRKSIFTDILVLAPSRHIDDRGFFSESWNSRDMQAAGIQFNWVQENHSFSKSAGTIRGLHYQIPPHAQTKLVRCGRGSFKDIFVDIRMSSETYGQWGSEIISFDEGNQILVPEGFAHGFITLEPNTEIIYKCSDFYYPALEGTISYDDPDLSIDWGSSKKLTLVSPKDQNGLQFQDLISPFK